MNFKILFSTILIGVSAFCFSSCGQKFEYSEKIDISDSLEWTLCDRDSPAEEVINGTISSYFKPIPWKGKHNLVSQVGREGNYIWIKSVFEIPESLKDRDLGLFIKYLHFADKVWINGEYVGGYGSFPPNEIAARYESHTYFFPKQMLNRDGENIILIKVWCHGYSEISGNVYVGCYEDVKRDGTFVDFANSKVYATFEGGMFACFILYFILFIVRRRKDGEYLMFSLMNFFSMQFGGMLFASDNFLYTLGIIPFLSMFKYGMCICFFITLYFLASFTHRYIFGTISKSLIIIRTILLIIPIFTVIFAKDYNALMKVAQFCLSLALLQAAFAANDIFKGLYLKEYRKKSLVLLIGLTPFLICVLVDVILRAILQKTEQPYISYFGWQFTMIFYFIVVSLRFNNALVKSEYLTDNLQKEVEIQTSEMHKVNDRLANELNKSKVDLQMAAIVQQKFFPYPSKTFIGWDMAVSYEPLSEVSGDLYDYYHIGNSMDGFSMFDVSGHGISSGLITVLSKDVIFQAFEKSRYEPINTSDMMSEINRKILSIKGSVDNYLTGILCSIKAFGSDDSCELQFANAGHPHPILFSEKSKTVTEVKAPDADKQYGAIGLNGVELKLSDYDFKMYNNDILVCYTDGLTESKNNSGELFGKERVKQIIAENSDKNAHEILDKLLMEQRKFMGNHPREDDVSILVMKRESPSDYIEEIGE